MIKTMKQEEKDLLLKDLCARLPYHVKCKIWLEDGTTEEGFLDLEHNYGNVLQDAFYYNEIKNIRPYLRPMSDMTKEERNKYESLCEHCMDEMGHDFCYDTIESFDYLISIHIDYRGLIPMGLALPAPKDMYKFD